MINNKYISLVLPCKDEARALKEVLRKAPSEIDEIIVVDNNSKDLTRDTGAIFGAKVIKEIRHKNGIGYGYALGTGIKETKGNIIVCMDGDGSYPIFDVPRLVRRLDRDGLDFISCNRLPFRNRKDMSMLRTTGVKLLNMAVFALFGYKIKDCLSGMWVFRKDALENSIFSEGDWNFSLEIKLNAIRNSKIKFAEVPVFYHDRIFDSSKQNLFRTGLAHLFFLFKTRISTARLSLPRPEPTVAPV